MAAKCGPCGGSGVLTPEAWSEWVCENRTRPLGQETPVPTDRIDRTCGECLGTGHEVTPAERSARMAVVMFIAESMGG